MSKKKKNKVQKKNRHIVMPTNRIRSSDTQKETIIIMGPFFAKSGYGKLANFVGRFFVRNYMDNYNLKFVPLGWSNSINKDEADFDNEELEIFNRAIHPDFNAIHNMHPDHFIQITIPNEAIALGKRNYLVTAGLESNSISEEWKQIVSQLNGLIVTSQHNKTIFRGSTPNIGVIKWGEKDNPDETIAQSIEDLNITTPFNFLFTGQYLPSNFEKYLQGGIINDRKNVALLLFWFAETFKDNNDVGLILKTETLSTSIMDFYNTLDRLIGVFYDTSTQDYLMKNKNLMDRIYLLHGNLSDREMNSLYKHPKVKSFVSLSHGEGFCRPAFNAAWNGKPVVVPEWSSFKDFLDEKYSILLKGYMVPVSPSAMPFTEKPTPQGNVRIPVFQRNMKWWQPDEKNTKEMLKEMVTNYDSYKGKAEEWQTILKDKWSIESTDDHNVNMFDKMFK